MLYSLPKVGKTTFAAQIPDNLLLCFERGVNFLSGIYAVDIQRWSDLKAILRQLNKPDVKGKFKTITFDTVGIAWELCEEYICSCNNVSTIGDIPWGEGYKLVSKEFKSVLRGISMMGYGVVLIAHAKISNVKIDDDIFVEKVSPDLPARAQTIVNAFVDIAGYIRLSYDNSGNSTRTLVFRGNENVVAGTRAKYLPNEIPFSYEDLVDSLVKAIEMQEKIDNAKVTNDDTLQAGIIKRPFTETQDEARALFNEIRDGSEEVLEERLTLLQEKMKLIFGSVIRLSQIQENQQDLFELLIEEMKEILEK